MAPFPALARLGFGRSRADDGAADDDGPAGGAIGLRTSASVLAARFGIRKAAAEDAMAEGADPPGGGRLPDLNLDEEMEPRGGLKAVLFPTAAGLLILAAAGIVVWLSLQAETTVERLTRQDTVLTVPVRLPDGSLRFPPPAAPEPAPAATEPGHGASPAAPDPRGELAIPEAPPPPQPEPEPEPVTAEPAQPAVEPEPPPAPVEEPPEDLVDVPVTLNPSRNPDLLERGRAGMLPRIGLDGMRPWQYYARLFPQQDQRPRIAIVVGELGRSQAEVERVLARLPAAVTVAVKANQAGLQPTVDRLRGKGHEVLLSVPMEPLDYPVNDPGPGTLLASLPDERNIERLETALATVTGYVGLTSLTGGRFTQLPENLRPILAQTNRRGLVYVDSRLTPDSRATRIATELQLPRAVADTLVDRVPSPGGIEAQLAELERLARANGVAVGFAQPLPVTVERLSLWAGSLRDRGIVLAPVTATMNRQADR